MDIQSNNNLYEVKNMTNEKYTIQDAITLYNDGRYQDSVQVCIELVGEGNDLSDIGLLTAKSYLQMMEQPNDQTALNNLFTILESAYATSGSLEKCFEMEAEFFEAYNEWHRRIIKNDFSLLLNEPLLQNWVGIPTKHAQANLLTGHIIIYLADCIPNELLEVENCDLAAARKKYGKQAENKFTNEEFTKLVVNASSGLFEISKQRIESMGSGNREYYRNIMQQLLEPLYTANNMIEQYAFDNESGELTIKDLESLQYFAQLFTYALEAKGYPDGQALSILTDLGQRKVILSNLTKVYKQLSEVIDGFIIPALPILEPSKPVQQQTQSGGCYVATAVYGSYDCPEVWTLRRFRDNILAETWYGRVFIRSYYAISPTLVKLFGDTAWFKNIWKPTLDKMVEKLNNNGVENTAYYDREW